MFEKIIELDKSLLIFINGLGSEQWDGFWLFATKQLNWTPFFLLILFLLFKHLGWKKGFFVLLFMPLVILLSDQFTNLIRVIFKRLRPINDSTISDQLRILIKPQSYSFTSGHATTSSCVTMFLILLLKNHSKLIYAMLIFPLIFAYSRLYLGVHFPIDIIAGICIGSTLGCLFYKLFLKLEVRFFSN